MTKYLIAYGATAIVFLGIDFVWLAHVARRFYAAQLGDLLLDSPRLGAAAAFYLAYVAGIVFFAIGPALRADSILTALLHGGLFGFFAYATYDVTNYATLRNWPIAVVGVDIAWGTLLTAVSAAAGCWAARFFYPGS
ncbi:DUF2177 family protein [Roseibium sp.]|uniref:DUF2177 family protein n=1 Tax=Roseibium sp. TaxID=1936156 RepID=UPI003D0CBC78